MGLSMLTGCHIHANNQHKHKPHHKQKMHKAPRHGKHYGSDQGQVSNIEKFIVKADSSGDAMSASTTTGGIVGYQTVSGTGSDIATEASALGGAIPGNAIEQSNESDREIYRITVNVDNGDTLHIEYEEIEDLRIGDRVRIENGHIDLI